MIVDVECTANEKNLLIEHEKSGHRTRMVALSVLPFLVFVLVGLTVVYPFSVFFARAVAWGKFVP